MSQPLFRKPTAADRQDRWSWQLGRILGIPTRIHASFALLLLWVGISTWQSAHSGLAVVFGLGFALAIFTCVLLHEFGHALVARRFGINTRRITLLPIGGVAELERSPSDPRAEMWIAAAGPAVNLAIAAILSLVAVTTGVLGGSGIATLVLEGLIGANLMLALFNLIPAFPMDGGRVFRAWAERRHGRLRATRMAAKLGRWLALGFGGWAVFSGNWVLALVAGFVWFAAGRERAAVEYMAAREHEREAQERARAAQAQWIGGFGPQVDPRVDPRFDPYTHVSTQRRTPTQVIYVRQ
ncbi:MAG TPA: site-2 protease family protein [Enhygromyxa sp.]|nr:site-2 protease family protein [Enhygromyxa sp.]